MKRLMLTAALSLCFASAASAQVLIPLPGSTTRPTGPGGVGSDPFSQLFGPYAGQRVTTGGQTFQTTTNRGAFGSTEPGSMGVNGADLTDINNANITGHPTRFMSYNQYFMNSGASLGNTASGQLGGQSFRLIGGVNPLQSNPGQRPLRGRANTPQPVR